MIPFQLKSSQIATRLSKPMIYDRELLERPCCKTPAKQSDYHQAALPQLLKLAGLMEMKIRLED